MFRREWAEYAYSTHSRTARHFHILRRISYIDAHFGRHAQNLECSQ